jgi:N-carbamoylputrescine amidase
MTESGVQAIFIPHASPRTNAQIKHQSWMRHLPARAYDNSVFVVACNQWGDNQRSLTFPGNAVVIDPSGNIVQKKVSDDEGMLVVDLTEEALTHVRSHPMRHFFPNRRPELYR